MVNALRRRGDIEIGALLTTINEPAERVAMHAVRIDLLRVQAEALGLPLWLVPIPSLCPNGVYETAMRFRHHRRARWVRVHGFGRLIGCLTLTDWVRVRH